MPQFADRMIPPRTYEVQAGWSLSLVQSDEVVSWAADALAARFDSPSLRILAGLGAPLDYEEVKRLFERSLRELSIAPLPPERHVRFFTASVLRSMFAGARTRIGALKFLADLCISLNYQRELMDFYQLYFAKTDLESQQVQWYWKDADRSNIDSIIDDYANRWLAENGVEQLSNESLHSRPR